MQNNLKVDSQVCKSVKQAYRVLGMINGTFVNKRRDIMIRLYKSLVRPHLEYAAQSWNPHFEKDKIALERVQRRMTRMITGIKRLLYEDRLRTLGLLETRRTRSDLIETYKFLTQKSRHQSRKILQTK